MKETHQPLSESAILVTTGFGRERNNPQHIEEFNELVASAGIHAELRLKVYRSRPDPKYLIGSGKVAELREQAQAHNIGLTAEHTAHKALPQSEGFGPYEIWNCVGLFSAMYNRQIL